MNFIAAILSAGFCSLTYDMVRVLSLTATTMVLLNSSPTVPVRMDVADETPSNLPLDDYHTLDCVPVNLTMTVDISGILPEGLRDPRTGTPVLNFESICIMTLKSDNQLQHLTVDSAKKAIQDLCWNCFRIGILKRNFKMWLQTCPPETPGFPFGRYYPLDFDSTYTVVLNSHQFSLDTRHIHLRAHHPEGLLD